MAAATLLSILPGLESILDRVHCIPKPPHLSTKIPHDVILHIHCYHVKEKVLKAFWNPDQLLEPYSKLQVFPDYSQITLQQKGITKALQNHLILCWGYPSKLTITHNGIISLISTIEEEL